eukprot:1001452-Pyramimonas_sp.AAC.1
MQGVRGVPGALSFLPDDPILSGGEQCTLHTEMYSRAHASHNTAWADLRRARFQTSRQHVR